MIVFVYPHIDRAEYTAFRQIVTLGLPENFDEWDYLVFKKVAEAGGRGHKGVRQKIHVDEFIRYCEEHDFPKNNHFLEDFAQSKGKQLGLA